MMTDDAVLTRMIANDACNIDCAEARGCYATNLKVVAACATRMVDAWEHGCHTHIAQATRNLRRVVALGAGSRALPSKP